MEAVGHTHPKGISSPGSFPTHLDMGVHQYWASCRHSDSIVYLDVRRPLGLEIIGLMKIFCMRIYLKRKTPWARGIIRGIMDGCGNEHGPFTWITFRFLHQLLYSLSTSYTTSFYITLVWCFHNKHLIKRFKYIPNYQ